MLTGSVASSYYGRPRSTHDADVVIDPTRTQLDLLIDALDTAGFYANASTAARAFERRTAFNVIEVASASKFDLILKRDRPFSIEEFSRRRPVDFGFRARVPLASPEDAILSKLEWARLSGTSERQLADIRGILDVTPNIDLRYVERWVVVLNLGDLWRQVSDRDDTTA